MSRKIFKYQIPSRTGMCEVNMPEGAQIIHFGTQKDYLYLWAEVDDSKLGKPYFFWLAFTGDDVLSNYPFHIGTVQVGPIVWHLYTV